MTLSEIVAAYEARRSAQLADRPVLTPLGAAVVARRRLARSLEPLTSQERREIAEIPQIA
jgi:hypothetical protein